MDRRQNNGGVKAVSSGHYPATCALRNCCFNCCVWAESQKQCPLHCCWRTTRSERSPTFAAQLHLPTHDLLWANLKVQLHLPPLRSLDLLISPGSLVKQNCSVCWQPEVTWFRVGPQNYRSCPRLGYRKWWCSVSVTGNKGVTCSPPGITLLCWSSEINTSVICEY